MKILDRKDRVHALTNNYEWTIMKNPGDRGFGNIADVRHIPDGLVLVSESIPNFTINDPLSGGLFSFGMIVALPKISDPPYDPGNFWNWAWELTTKRTGAGFGIITKALHIIQPNRILASCSLGVFQHLIGVVRWSYTFHDHDSVEVDMTIQFYQYPGLWIKEPKIVANGLQNYNYLAVLDINGKQITKGRSLASMKDPKKKTVQINHPDRRGVIFKGPDLPEFTIYNDRGLEEMYDLANQSPAMHDDPGPLTVGEGKYCMPDSENLLRQWEVPYWPDHKVSGLAMHVWEGGYGAPDCWNCFRPYPKSIKYNAKLSAAFN